MKIRKWLQSKFFCRHSDNFIWTLNKLLNKHLIMKKKLNIFIKQRKSILFYGWAFIGVRGDVSWIISMDYSMINQLFGWREITCQLTQAHTHTHSHINKHSHDTYTYTFTLTLIHTNTNRVHSHTRELLLQEFFQFHNVLSFCDKLGHFIES